MAIKSLTKYVSSKFLSSVKNMKRHTSLLVCGFGKDLLKIEGIKRYDFLQLLPMLSENISIGL